MKLQQTDDQEPLAGIRHIDALLWQKLNAQARVILQYLRHKEGLPDAVFGVQHMEAGGRRLTVFLSAPCDEAEKKIRELWHDVYIVYTPPKAEIKSHVTQQ